MRTALVDGLKTLFYDGSKGLLNQGYYNELDRTRRPALSHLSTTERWNLLSDESQKYWMERWSWQQVIVEEGVTEIATNSFYRCVQVKRVIFAKTMTKIRRLAFNGCKSLRSIRLPLQLEYIGYGAFSQCNLSSVFIPPRCRKVKRKAFQSNKNLSIFHVPHETELAKYCIANTKLAELAPF